MNYSKKTPHIRKLEKLLEAPGTVTSWPKIAAALHTLPLEIIIALLYRVESARAEAFDEGVLQGEPKV